MAIKPTEATTELVWASNDNYSGISPPKATKLEPSAGRKADGWKPAEEPTAQNWNWWCYWMAEWVNYQYDAWATEHDDDGTHSDNFLVSAYVDWGLGAGQVNDGEIPILDSSGYFAGTTVEDALDELAEATAIVDHSIYRRHLLEASNLVKNPSAQLIDKHWADSGGGAPNWAAVYDTDFAKTGGYDPERAPYWSYTNVALSNYIADDSDKIYQIPTGGVNLTIAAYMRLQSISTSVGNAAYYEISVQEYNVSDVLIGQAGQIRLTAAQGPWILKEATFALNASTAYVKVRKYVGNAAGDGTHNVVAAEVARIKLSVGTIAPSFSDDLSIPQAEVIPIGDGSGYFTGDVLSDALDELAEGTAIQNKVIHRRHLNEGSNLLINPTGRMGNAFWWGDSGTVDPDPEYANAPVWTENIWTNTLGQGPYWVISGPSASTQGDIGEKISITNGVALTLSCEISLVGVSAGSVKAEILCYDVSGNLLSTICQTTVSTNVAFAKYEATGTTPASTSYIRIRKWIDNLTATTVAIRRMKCESGAIATAYSDESSMGQYLSARYTTNAGQSIPDSAVYSIVIYEDIDWDNPGSDRYNTGTGIFTADRFMRLRVSARIEYDQESPSQWGVGDIAALQLVSTGIPTTAKLDGTMVAVATPNNWSPKLNGSTTVKLNKGDTFQIETRQQGTGGNRPLDTAAGSNHLSIEEIN